LLEGSKCLRLTVDGAIDATWFVELLTLSEPSLAQLKELPDARFEWSYASGLGGTGEDQQALFRELLRVVGNGFLVLADGDLARRYSTAAPPDAHYNGAAAARFQYCDAVRVALPEAALLELVTLDHCSLTLDSVLVVSRDARRLREMAAAATSANIHARVFAPAAPGSVLARVRAQLPIEFDEAIYRSIHRDLSRFTGQELRDHYRAYGEREGRRAHALENRQAFAALLEPELDILEIGPYYDPLVRGPKVRYFDIDDKPRLQARAARHGLPTGRVPDVHYVSETADLSIVDATFDAAISNHFVARQPDFVGHLDSVRRLLRPGGLYFALIPDKNYCFDHFMAASTIAELMEAHVLGRNRHTLRSLLAYAALRTHNDPRRHWRGDHEPVTPSVASIQRTVQAFLGGDGGYEDVHAWYFDPTSFKNSMQLLQQIDETDFTLERVYPTQTNSNEFWVVLAANGGAP
jgi:SAM-dependent methyltransferase